MVAPFSDDDEVDAAAPILMTGNLFGGAARLIRSPTVRLPGERR